MILPLNRTRNEVDHDGIIVHITDYKLDNSFGIITAFTKNRSVAELSEHPIPIKGLVEPVYYFNRIKVLPAFEGKGEGKALMIELCKVVDKHKITIYNELNPYGKRDMDSLKSFFKASGFKKFKNGWNDPNIMVRIPRRIYAIT